MIKFFKLSIIEELFDPVTTRWGFIFAIVAVSVFLIMLKIREKKNTNRLIEEARKEKEQEKNEDKQDK